MYTEVFAFIDRLTPLQAYAASIGVLLIICALGALVQIALNLNAGSPDLYIPQPDASGLPPTEPITLVQVLLIAASLAAAMIFLDDSADEVSIAHTATAAQRADVQRLQVLNDIVDQRCPAPDAAEREIVLIDWRTSADLHTNAGAHISCERYLQRGWFTAATTPKGPQ